MTIEFPIGRLHDIELYFLHYKDKEEALEKLKAWKVDPHDESWVTK